MIRQFINSSIYGKTLLVVLALLNHICMEDKEVENDILHILL